MLYRRANIKYIKSWFDFTYAWYFSRKSHFRTVRWFARDCNLYIFIILNGAARSAYDLHMYEYLWLYRVIACKINAFVIREYYFRYIIHIVYKS